MVLCFPVYVTVKLFYTYEFLEILLAILLAKKTQNCIFFKLALINFSFIDFSTIDLMLQNFVSTYITLM